MTVKYEKSLVEKLTRRRATGVVLGLSGVLAAACGQAVGTGAGTGAASTSSGTTGAATSPNTAFANPNLVVNTAWLKQHLKDPNVRIVDTRPAADYAKGHIPGAVNIPVVETFDPDEQKNFPASQEALETLLGENGIDNATRVITYDAGKATPAARLFWTLEYLGHTKAAVLDGGLGAWDLAKGELSTQQPEVAPATFVSTIDPAKMPTKQTILSVIGKNLAILDKSKVVLDTRSAAEYRGEDVRAKFGGHIPGAVHIDWRENLTDEGLLKAPTELHALYESKGVTKDKEIIAHCQTGQRSSVTYWVLRLLDYPKVGNYAGSWIEWGNDPGTPKVQGS